MLLSNEIKSRDPEDACEGVDSHEVSFTDALWVWVKIALNSFGGPAGQIAVMHRYLVEEKRWISEERFLHALNYCMLLPGPEAQQLATYIGWLLHKTPGGIVAGTLFVIPGFFCMLVLSILYAGYQNLSFVQWLFFGLKPAVLAIVIEAVLRIGKRALNTKFAIMLAALAFVSIFFFDVPFPVIIFSAAFLGYLGERLRPELFKNVNNSNVKSRECRGATVDTLMERGELLHARPSLLHSLGVALVWSALWFVPIILVFLFMGPQSVLFQESVFFSKMAVVTFGGAYAVPAYVAQQAVETHGWLNPGEMLDGLGLAETTPGPLIMVLQFVGFLGAYRNPGGLDPMMSGILGAVLRRGLLLFPVFCGYFWERLT